MDFIESIGPVLGIVAFVGLAALAFLLFQQARDLRRLREWAGRAPERAQEAADAVQAAGEASRTDGRRGSGSRRRARAGGLGAAWARFTGAIVRAWRKLERRLPVDGRYILAVARGRGGRGGSRSPAASAWSATRWQGASARRRLAQTDGCRPERDGRPGLGGAGRQGGGEGRGVQDRAH